MTEQEESNKAQTPYDQHEAGFIADAPSAKRVGFGTRLGAYILDIIIGGALGGLIGMFTGLEFAKALLGEASVEESMNMLSDYSGMLAMVFGAIAGMTLMFLFFILMESLLGQSPGKIILGIRIGNQYGTHASTGSLFARAFFKYFGTIMSLLAGISGIAILSSVGSFGAFIIFIGFFFALSENKLTFHDMIAKRRFLRSRKWADRRKAHLAHY